MNNPLPEALGLVRNDTDSSQKVCSDQDAVLSRNHADMLHQTGPAFSLGTIPQSRASPRQKLVSNPNSTRSFTADTGVSTSNQQLLLRASLLAQAMDRAGPVRISSESVVVPREWLRDALQATVQALVSEALDDFQVNECKTACPRSIWLA
jgi:hypothetical protein